MESIVSRFKHAVVARYSETMEKVADSKEMESLIREGSLNFAFRVCPVARIIKACDKNELSQILNQFIQYDTNKSGGVTARNVIRQALKILKSWPFRII